MSSTCIKEVGGGDKAWSLFIFTLLMGQLTNKLSLDDRVSLCDTYVRIRTSYDKSDTQRIQHSSAERAHVGRR